MSTTQAGSRGWPTPTDGPPRLCKAVAKHGRPDWAARSDTPTDYSNGTGWPHRSVRSATHFSTHQLRKHLLKNVLVA
jgi:hypothetical protein